MIFRETRSWVSNVGALIGGGIASGVATMSMNVLIKRFIQSKKESITSTGVAGEIEKRNQFYLKDMMLNVVNSMASLAKYYFLNFNKIQPAAVISGIPLGTVTELSHAMSNDLLKFRSAGGIFLAHQEGGEQSLRIQGKAWGANRHIFLIMLDFLFRYGSSTIVDLFSKGLKTDNNRMSDIGMNKNLDPWEPINKYSLEQGISTLHKTFPVITQNRVYTSMYIETYDFTESIENGMNCITYTIFFRKNQPIPPQQFVKVTDIKSGKDTYYYRSDNKDPLLKTLRSMDMALDVGLSVSLLVYRSFVIASGNNIERNMAVITSLGLLSERSNISNTEDLLIDKIEQLTYEDSLSGLSTQNKEELMQID